MIAPNLNSLTDLEIIVYLSTLARAHDPMLLRQPHQTPRRAAHHAAEPTEGACLTRQRNHACVDQRFVSLRVDAANLCCHRHGLLRLGHETCRYLLEIVAGEVACVELQDDVFWHRRLEAFYYMRCRCAADGNDKAAVRGEELGCGQHARYFDVEGFFSFLS
ncbi:hypothetical protein HG531_007272 [Fusarium graminearum]|nr:hypothetical protein HG531_007272 [Fusarium graminearum]